MTISDDAKKVLSSNANKIDNVEYGNIDLIINKGKIVRVDIRKV